MRLRIAALVLLATSCGGARPSAAPPAPTTSPAPVLTGLSVMLFPTQRGRVPSADTNAVHLPLSNDKLDAEIAYWLPQTAATVKWVMPATLQRVIARSPTLAVDMHNLAVGSFQRAQVKRIGDPLFGDLRKLAAVVDARVAVIPIAAEMIGTSAATARAQVAVAVIDPIGGDVLWFGIIEGAPNASDEDSAVASAAQAFGRAFAGKRN